jgi:nicotinate-nucleotide pyrophosphorylase (carboxylating)
MTSARQQQLEKAFFRGDTLTLENPAYLKEVQTLTEALLRADCVSRDLTVEALGIPDEPAKAVIIARERGIAAGLAEFALVLGSHGVSVHFEKQDGQRFETGETLVRLEGGRRVLLSFERVGLNLLQRMSGIATVARDFQARAQKRCPSTRVVATRKTLWGLLDKRAVHVGNGGTHRLGLGDGILIKNNHLALIARREEDAAPTAIERAWRFRGEAAFVEVEVRSEGAALAAAETFRRVQKDSGDPYPCLILLDNLEPREISRILDQLHQKRVWDYVLVEASGGISGENLEAYADTGVDAISMGALTHSVSSLDLCQRMS